jgi:DNA-nicking Smr family endonuclease
MNRRRPRGLTEEDRAVWATYAARVTPLPGRTLPAPPAITVTAPAAPPPARQSPAPPVIRTPPAAIAVGLPPAGLDAKRWTALRRGRLRPERTLDLHGRRAQDAHAAVRGFLADAIADGLRCVAIVTGKGSTVEGGVLRRELPHWLNAPELRPLLLGAAHPHRANAGAVHLLLRRRRA